MNLYPIVPTLGADGMIRGYAETPSVAAV